MPLDFLQLAGVCTGAVAIGGAVGAALQAGRKALKAEQVIVETVPRLEKKLDDHTKEDGARFDDLRRLLTRMDKKLDVAANDIAWLKDEAGWKK